jgi:hypothetical protein
VGGDLAAEDLAGIDMDQTKAIGEPCSLRPFAATRRAEEDHPQRAAGHQQSAVLI